MGAAIVTGIFKLLEMRMSGTISNGEEMRKRVEEKININTVYIDTLSAAIRVILHDRIKHLARVYISNDKVSYDDRRDLIEMHKIYHEGLGGNGNLDALMKDFMDIQIM